MGRASRDKGARGERELAKVLGELTGLEWRRGVSQSRHGGAEGADVECVDVEAWNDWHIEVKRRKDRVDLHAAMVQACADAEGRDCSPVVIWRVDRQPWRVTVRAGDLAIDTISTGLVGWHQKSSGGHPPQWRAWDGEYAALVTLDLQAWLALVCYWWKVSR